MATKLDQLVIELAAETTKLRSELKLAVDSTTKATNSMEKAVKEFSDNSNKNLTGFETAVASMAGFLGSQAVLGVFNLVKDAAAAMGAALVDGGQSAINQELAFTKMANALALSGQYSRQAQADLEAFANEMEAVTGISDDVVAGNIAILASLTKLDSEGLKVAQKAAIDFAEGMSIDIGTATNLVAKGINGNVEAFKRYGIVIEEGATKTDTFRNVVQALDSQFGNASAGAMKTFRGVILATNNAFGNFTEEIARNVTGNEVLIAVIGEIKRIFDELTKSAENTAGTLKHDVGAAILTVIEMLAQGVTFIDTFVRTMETGFRTILLPINAVADGLRSIGSLLSGEENKGFEATKAQFEALQETIEGDSALGNLATRLLEIQNAGEKAFTTMSLTAEATTPTIQGTTEAVEELTEAEKRRIDQLQSFSDALIVQSEDERALMASKAEALKVQMEDELISREEYFSQLNELQMEQFDTERQMLEDARANNLITEQEYAIAQAQLKKNQTEEAAKLERQKTKDEAEQQKIRLANLKQTFGFISSLSQSENQTLAAIGKSAAIAQATMDTYAAANVAMKSAPPPFNFALAGLTVAAGLANVAKIGGVGLKTGIDRVPGIGSNDNFPAVLAPGERVVPSKTNEDLTRFLQNQESMNSSRTINIVIENRIPASREAGAQMIEAINDALSTGSLKILGMA